MPVTKKLQNPLQTVTNLLPFCNHPAAVTPQNARLQKKQRLFGFVTNFVTLQTANTQITNTRLQSFKFLERKHTLIE